MDFDSDYEMEIQVAREKCHQAPINSIRSSQASEVWMKRWMSLCNDMEIDSEAVRQHLHGSNKSDTARARVKSKHFQRRHVQLEEESSDTDVPKTTMHLPVDPQVWPIDLPTSETIQSLYLLMVSKPESVSYVQSLLSQKPDVRAMMALLAACTLADPSSSEDRAEIWTLKMFASACYIMFQAEIAEFFDISVFTKAIMMNAPEDVMPERNCELREVLLQAIQTLCEKLSTMTILNSEMLNTIIEALVHWLRKSRSKGELKTISAAFVTIVKNSLLPSAREYELIHIVLCNLVPVAVQLFKRDIYQVVKIVLMTISKLDHDDTAEADDQAANAEASEELVTFIQHVSVRAPERAEPRALLVELICEIFPCLVGGAQSEANPDLLPSFRLAQFLYLASSQNKSTWVRMFISELCEALLLKTILERYERAEVNTEMGRFSVYMLRILEERTVDIVPIVRAKAISSLSSVIHATTLEAARNTQSLSRSSSISSAEEELRENYYEFDTRSFVINEEEQSKIEARAKALDLALCRVRREVLLTARSMMSLGSNFLQNLVSVHAQDAKSGVRKAVVGLMHSLIATSDRSLAASSQVSPTPAVPWNGTVNSKRRIALLSALGARCSDAIPAVRKAAIDAVDNLVPLLVARNPKDESAALTVWMRCVLPRVLDSEILVQERALQSVQELLVQPIRASFSPVEESGRTRFASKTSLSLLRLVLANNNKENRATGDRGPKEVRNLDKKRDSIVLSTSGKYMSRSLTVLAQRGELSADFLEGLQRVAMENNNDSLLHDSQVQLRRGAWCLLSDVISACDEQVLVKIFKASTVLKFALTTSGVSDEQTADAVVQAASLRVLAVLPRGCFATDQQLTCGKAIAEKIVGLVEESSYQARPGCIEKYANHDDEMRTSDSPDPFALISNSAFVSTSLAAMCNLLQSEPLVLNDILQRSCSSAEHLLNQYVNDDPSSRNYESILRASLVLGEIAALPVNMVSGEKFISVRALNLLQVILSSDFVASKQNQSIEYRVRSQVVITLGKCCLSDSLVGLSVSSTSSDGIAGIVRRCIPSFVREIDSRSVSCRNNALLVLCDLCRKFASMVEPHLARLALCVRDPSVFIRRQAVTSFGTLLQEDYLKARSGSLLFRLLISLVDDSSTDLRNIATYVLTQIVHPKNKRLVSLKFFDFIFFLNDCTVHPSFNQECSLTEAERRSGVLDILNQQKRLEIYDILIRHCMDTQDRIKLPSRLCVDILSCISVGQPIVTKRVAEIRQDGGATSKNNPEMSPSRFVDTIRLDQPGVQGVVADALTLMMWPIIRSAARKYSATAQGKTSDGEDLSATIDDQAQQLPVQAEASGETSASTPSTLVAMKNRLLMIAAQTDLELKQIPTLKELHAVLVSSHSPLLKACMECFHVLLGEYGQEWPKLFADAPELRDELQYDIGKIKDRNAAALPARPMPYTGRELLQMDKEEDREQIVFSRELDLQRSALKAKGDLQSLRDTRERTQAESSIATCLFTTKEDEQEANENMVSSVNRLAKKSSSKVEKANPAAKKKKLAVVKPKKTRKARRSILSSDEEDSGELSDNDTEFLKEIGATT